MILTEGRQKKGCCCDNGCKHCPHRETRLERKTKLKIAGHSTPRHLVKAPLSTYRLICLAIAVTGTFGCVAIAVLSISRLISLAIAVHSTFICFWLLGVSVKCIILDVCINLAILYVVCES